MIGGIMIKPVGDLCNLRCSYCYYRGVSPKGSAVRTLELERLEGGLAQWLGNGPEQVTISFQGGEPTLAGLKWFEDFFGMVERLGRAGRRVNFALQSNGLQFDRAWAGLLKSYSVLVGLSIDGPEAVHDYYRRDALGQGSFQRVRQAGRLLLEEGVDVNAIVLLNDRNVSDARSLYHFLKGEGFEWLQFIPCVEWDERGELRPFCVDADSYGQFLLDMFDTWYPPDVGKVFVRYFESVLAKIAGLSGSLCYLQRHCDPGLTIEHDGSVYGCDHFVRQQWRLGTIDQADWMQWNTHPVYMRFGRAKADLPRGCRSCRFVDICGGGCPKHRYQGRGINVLCGAYKQFFQKNLGRMEGLVRRLKTKQSRWGAV